MVFTVYYLDPRIEQDVDKEETKKAVARGIHPSIRGGREQHPW